MTNDRAMQTFNEMKLIQQQLQEAGYTVRKLPRRLVLSVYKPESGHNAVVFSDLHSQWRASIPDARLDSFLNVNAAVGAGE